MTIQEGIRKCHPGDRRLMAAYGIAGVLCLAGAFALAAVLTAIKTPALGLARGDLYYRLLTGHAILGFVYWFAYVQAALLIAGATALREGGRLWSLKLGWVAFASTTVGLALNMIGVFTGADVLYTAFPPLAESFPATPLIYLGYLFVALGALLITADFLATVVSWVERPAAARAWKRMLAEIHISTYAAICAVPLVFSIVLTAFFLYVPALLVSLGWRSPDATAYPLNFRLTYHVMFHIIHYIPAMAMIAAAYVLVELTTGAQSVYRKTVAKGLFLMYPAVVPPTFVYHLMADPTLPQSIKIIGSALSLLVWIPSLLHMFIIMGMMEAHMRSAGHTLFGWMKHLPWRNPAFGSLAMSLVTFGIAGALTAVLLQEQTASLLHSTFAVPAYVHPIVVGAASLTYMGLIYYAVSIAMGLELRGAGLARIQPYLMTAGLLVFAVAGTPAGYAGVPRRTADISFGGLAPESWAGLMNLTMGIGGTLTLAAGVLFFIVIGMTLLSRRRLSSAVDVSRELAVLQVARSRECVFTPTALIPGVLFVLAVLILTVGAFRIMDHWPIRFG
jgi:cytochrome c oxidase subunit I